MTVTQRFGPEVAVYQTALGFVVRERLDRQRHDPEDVIRVLEIGRADFVRRLTGSRPFTVLELVRLADLLGTTVAELLCTVEARLAEYEEEGA